MKYYLVASPQMTIPISPVESETEKLIRGFKEMEPGWHFGKGTAPSSDVIDQAIRVLRFGIQLGFTRNDAFPGQSGEIQVSFYRDDATVEVIIEPDLCSYVHFEQNDQEYPPFKALNYIELQVKLSAIAGQIWNTSTSSVQYITTLQSVATPNLLFDTPQTAADHQMYKYIVQRMGPEVSVPIFGNIMGPGSAVIPLYSGDSKKERFHKEVA